MKLSFRWLGLALLFICMADVRAQTTPSVMTMHDAATATGNGTSLVVGVSAANPGANLGAVGVQIVGTFSATITFEATTDGTNWTAIMATELADDSRATTATAAGHYTILYGSAIRIRARISSYSSGSVTVKARLIPGLTARLTSGGGGGGSGTVTSVAFTGGLISVGDPTAAAALTVAGTSGGIVYFDSATSWASSAALAANALVIGGGAGAAPSTTTTGTGVLTALGVNVGSAGAFVTFNGALGTPSSGTLTSATGLPISTGVSGLGTGVATFLATPSSANLASALTDETGSGAAVFGTAPTIAGGSITALTALGVRSTGTGAFDLTLANTENLTAGRTLTIALGDAARTLTIGASASVSGSNTGDQTSVSGNAGTATALQTARTIGGVSFDGTANITVASATGGFAVTTELTTPSTTFALANATATTVNAFGAATTINVGTSATVLSFGGGATAGEFRFLEPSGSGTNYSAFKSVAQAANITYSLPPTVGAAGTVLTDAAGDGVLSWAAGGGGSAPFDDATAIIKGSADATKLLRIEVDGFTTGTTRVLTPPNADATIAGQNFANTFSAAQAFSSTITQTSASAAAFESGPNGGTNPVFRLVSSIASQADGLSITGLAAGSGVTLTALSSGSNAPINLAPKGSSNVGVSTGGIQFGAQTIIGQSGGTNDFQVSAGGLVRFLAGASGGGAGGGAIVPSDGFLGFSSTTGATGSVDTRLRRSAAANLAQGAADAASPVAQTLSVQNVVGGTSNTVGADWTKKASAGTGTGVGGAHVWQIAPAGGSGTTQNSFVEAMRITGAGVIQYPTTITAGGTTGNQTINKVSGTVNIAAAGTTVTVTDSLVSANSICFGVLRTNDATAALKNIVPGAGSFVITLTAAATAETSVGFFCINP